MEPAVLFISYDGITDPLGQSQVLPYLAGLRRMGYQIVLISCEKPAEYTAKFTEVKTQTAEAGIHWYPLPYTKRPPVISTLIDLYRIRKKALTLHREYNFRLVHTRPGIPALVGVWLKKKKGIPFLHDIREFYADSRVEGGIWNARNPLFQLIYRYFKRKETEQLQCCDGIVCLTKTAESVIRKEPAFKTATPLEVIPCSVDLQLFSLDAIDKKQQEALQRDMGITPDDTVITYLGSIGGWYLTDEMMRFCKLLSQKLPGAKFLFISPHLHEQIRESGRQHGIDPSQIIIRKSDRSDIPQLLSLSTFSVFFIKPCFSKLSSSPTKHGELMAMGIPVITNAGVGDVQAIVEKYHAGYLVKDFSDKSFNTVINQMLQEPIPDPAEIRRGAEEIYSLEKAVEAYGKMYGKILKVE